MKIQIIADLHCGSEAGLTPFPKSKLQKELLNRYEDCIKHFGTRPDILIVNGDAVDGLQLRGKSKDDDDSVPDQVSHAVNLIKMWRAKEVFLVSGTPYHTVSGPIDFEELLAMQLRAGGIKCTYTRKLNLTVCDWFRLQARHKIGSSGIPHGRFTSQNRSKAWGVLNAAASGSKPVHLSIFSHVHYWTYSESFLGATMTTPAWQAIGGLYGDTACDGHVDIGAVRITVGKTEEDGWAFQKRLYQAAVVDRTVCR